mgnify:CR=1 FL=1
MSTQTASAKGIIRDYIALMKPRIISLLLLTALGGMFLATRGVPEPLLVFLVLAGGTLAAGGAHSINNYLDRDVDSMMHRTSHRPVVEGRISPHQALGFGIILNIIAFAILGYFVNPISALITLSGTLFYVFIYTLLLKRRTPQNIVIGGAAGAVPPIVGWAAVTGSVDLPALYLFAIIFFWTPPHFWALSLLIKDDYARAGIPMLPVVTSVAQTKRSILLYTFILIALTTMFFTTQAVGWFYLATSLLLGILFVYYAFRLLKRPGIEGARSAYLYSLLYLALLFIFIATDAFIPV